MSGHRGGQRIRGRLVTAGLVVAVVSVVPMSAVFADQPLDGTGPSSAGMPGTALVRQLLGWGFYLGLAACGMVILYGAATWAGFGSASSGRAVNGKTFVIAGLIGALIIGLVPTMVSLLFNAGTGG